MFTMLAIVSIVLAAGVLLWRLAAAGQRPPGDNDRSRQHEVPGADQPPPPPPPSGT